MNFDFSDITAVKTAYHNKLKELKTAIEGGNGVESYEFLSETMAIQEVHYRKAKAKEYLKLKNDSIQATLIPTIAKGNVGDELLLFKVSEAVFHARRENIKRLHSNLEALRSFLSSAKKEIDMR